MLRPTVKRGRNIALNETPLLSHTRDLLHIDPTDREEFEAYLNDLNRITEASPYGQTLVIVRRREQYLPLLVMGGHQKVKQLLAYEESVVSEQISPD